MELLRERIPARTSLIVVGSTDDHLRVDKANHVLNGITQSMVDNIVVNEIREFTLICLLHAPKPRQTILSNANISNLQQHRATDNEKQYENIEPKFKKPKYDSDTFKKIFINKNDKLKISSKPLAHKKPIQNDQLNERINEYDSNIMTNSTKSTKLINNDFDLLDLDATDLLNTNILDMPITFADLDECIEESICDMKIENNNNYNHNNNNNHNSSIKNGGIIKLNGTAKLVKIPSCDKGNFDFFQNQQLINLKTSINQVKM